ncbi:MAG: rRNA maturation RNase YbeY [Bdellovibrionaceae bacterium]|jgi:probable rRNA maturation factor|nr:rRNA maturation RNase YbeY [Pseudobdellovibrionaceae bacterium]
MKCRQYHLTWTTPPWLSLELSLHTSLDQWPLPPSQQKQWILWMLPELYHILKKKRLVHMWPQKQSPLFLSLLLVGKQKMKTLNHQYRKRDYATDVLSFGSPPPAALGELVFCWPVIEKQAREQKHSAQAEWCYLCLHGLLHLLGFDHEYEDRYASEMWDIQNALFLKAEKAFPL